MSGPSSTQQWLVVRALDHVRTAAKARNLFRQIPVDGYNRTTENDEVTRIFLEESVRSAMRYGYPAEAVADAAELTLEEVSSISTGPTAA